MKTSDKLTPREQSLYDTLASMNREGEYPTKAELIRRNDPRGHIPNQTRADRYRLIDQLKAKGRVGGNQDARSLVWQLVAFLPCECPATADLPRRRHHCEEDS